MTVQLPEIGTSSFTDSTDTAGITLDTLQSDGAVTV